MEYRKFTESTNNTIPKGKVILGGCCVPADNPEWHCNDYEYDL